MSPTSNGRAESILFRTPAHEMPMKNSSRLTGTEATGAGRLAGRNANARAPGSGIHYAGYSGGPATAMKEHSHLSLVIAWV
jgi:hypothetical protein